MTDKEIRSHLSEHMLGAAMGMGLIVDGLAGKIAPSQLTDEQRITFQELAGRTQMLCAKWSELALSMRDSGA